MSTIIIILICIIVLALLYFSLMGLVVMLTCFLRTNKSDANFDPSRDDAATFRANGRTPYRLSAREGNIWWNSQSLERYETVSKDGLRLVGHLLRAEGSAKRVALVMHGHRCVSGEIGFIAHALHDMGYHVFAPDQRSHGKSEGKYIGMGNFERLDMMRWLELIEQIFSDGCEIMLYGNSMGATSVMMLAGESALPGNVVCAVEDCGYSNAWDVVYLETKRRAPMLPLKKVIMVFADLWLRLLAGYSMCNIDCCAALKRSMLPMLFIHGTADPTVPVSMLHELAAAHEGETETLVMAGAEHGVSFFKDEALYTETMRAFADRYFTVP